MNKMYDCYSVNIFSVPTFNIFSELKLLPTTVIVIIGHHDNHVI